jgi:signal transduction histidine kinase
VNLPIARPDGWRKRLPLRWRVAVAFAFASLLVTGAVAFSTWKLASRYMLEQREQSAIRQATVNEQLVTRLMRSPDTNTLSDALAGLAHSAETTIAVRRGQAWVVSGRPVDLTQLPSPLIDTEPAALPIPRHAVVDHLPVLVVSLALPEPSARFVELFPLVDLEQALRFLRTVLLGATASSAVVGLLLGRWASRQALRPLTELTLAAGRVAAGDLSARLPAQGDRDLAPLATTFNRTITALEQRVERDAQFAGDVSHELRSPLTTMINAIAVLNRRKDELSPTSRHALQLLDADVQRFHQMVIDLLEMSRGYGPMDDRELEPCDLVELVGHAMAVRREPAPLQVDEPHPMVLADRRRLHQAVTNLLDNAHRHGGGTIRVAVLRSSPLVARLEVDDAGPGVPLELGHQVFERFTRGNRSGDRGDGAGTGLGLALVAQHVHRHTGAVWVEQRPGGGARFIIELPQIQI